MTTNSCIDTKFTAPSFLSELPLYPLGGRILPGGIRFSYVPTCEDAACGVVLFDAAGKVELTRIPFLENDRIGQVYQRYVSLQNYETVTYCFYEKDQLVTDQNAVCFVDTIPYGSYKASAVRKACLLAGFAWEGDQCPKIPYEDSLVYLLHVRGFTKGNGSGVKNKGTFSAVEEKIPYLKSMGITTLLMQPVYDFPECYVMTDSASGEKSEKLNYWGYCSGNYYVPKSSYAAGEATTEFRQLVKVLHREGMEVVLQFYFDESLNFAGIRDVLLHWIREYHIDGVQVLGASIQMNDFAEDPVLSGIKIWNDHVNEISSFSNGYYDTKKKRRFGLVQDEFLYTLRRFIKGDAGQLDNTLRLLRFNPSGCGVLNYLATYWGYTLADTFTYEHKHNEENGEDNRDGCDYNCSWNCGEEGPTRKPKIKELRTRLIKNAMTLLMLSAGTPVLFMGDEFGNSQKGNNNPYCIDSPVTWLDWKQLEKNKDLYSYFCSLVELRKQIKVLHRTKECTMLDEHSCGFPDLSYHSDSAWKYPVGGSNSAIGILYCDMDGKEAIAEDKLVFVAINCSWIKNDSALPKPPKGYEWKLAFSTGAEPKVVSELSYELEPRTIAIYKTKASQSSVLDSKVKKTNRN